MEQEFICYTSMSNFESAPIIETDSMGREKFWGQEEPNLSVKLFSEICCSGCTCGK